MTTRSLLSTMALLALACVPAPVTAQRPDGGQPMLGSSPAQSVLEHQAALALTPEQVAKLQAVDARVKEQEAPLLEKLRAAGMGEPGRQRGLSPEERRAMRTQREELRPTLVQLRQVRQAAMQEVRALLAPEQQRKLRALMRGSMRERRGGEGKQPGRGRDGGRDRQRAPEAPGA